MFNVSRKQKKEKRRDKERDEENKEDKSVPVYSSSISRKPYGYYVGSREHVDGKWQWEEEKKKRRN